MYHRQKSKREIKSIWGMSWICISFLIALGSKTKVKKMLSLCQWGKSSESSTWTRHELKVFDVRLFSCPRIRSFLKHLVNNPRQFWWRIQNIFSFRLSACVRDACPHDVDFLRKAWIQKDRLYQYGCFLHSAVQPHLMPQHSRNGWCVHYNAMTTNDVSNWFATEKK